MVNAAGLTESQLEEEIKQILSPNILKEPSVSVALETSQSRKFSVLGNGISRPGRYDIPRYDYRLADALAIAGGISQFNISYIYVSRPITGKKRRLRQPYRRRNPNKKYRERRSQKQAARRDAGRNRSNGKTWERGRQ